MKEPFLVRFAPLAVLLSIALFVVGAGMVMFGFTAMAYDEPLHVTAGFIAAGAATIAGSIGLGIVTERRLRAREQRQIAEWAASPAGKRAKARRKLMPAPDALLGEWTLAPDEWRAYVEQEADLRRGNAWEPALVGAAFGGVTPYIFTGTWHYSAIGAPTLAAIAFVGALISAARTRKRVPRAGGSVVVRRNAVEIDGDRAVLRDDRWWLSGAKLLADLPFPVLELTVSTVSHQRNGSRRAQSDVVRVPVPRARE
ncbi:MAG TPA: hypothetical protein VF771_10160, partial [Longimicrobiaceae bacterium]